MGGIAALGASGAISAFALSISDEDAIASLIRASFPGEKFSESDLTKFARISTERHGPFSRGQVLAMESGWLRAATDNFSDRDVRTIPGKIIADFVRSSDILDPDRTATPSYFSYADPYSVGCSNPLPFYSGAQLEWPDTIYG